MPKKKTNQFARTYSTTKDIFSVGVWNGIDITEEDIDDIISNFDKLKKANPSYKVPLKIDLFKNIKPESNRHGGEPAAGWITQVKKIGKSIFAHIENIPKVIKNMIENKQYRQVSAELFKNIEIGGEKLGRALKAVALLGVELPGVENLNEFAEFYNLELDNEIIESYIVEDNKSNSKIKKGGNQDMDLDKKIAELEAIIEKFKKEAEENTSKIKTLEDEKEKLEKSNKEGKTKMTELTNGQRSEEIDAFIAKQKETGKILPANEASVKSIMENLSDDETLTFTKDGKEVKQSPRKAFEAQIESLPNIVEFAEKSQKEKEDGTEKFKAKDVDEFGSENEQEANWLTERYMKEHNEKLKEEDRISYEDAYLKVLEEHPELK